MRALAVAAIEMIRNGAPLSSDKFGSYCFPTIGHLLLLMSVVRCEFESLPAVVPGS